MPSNARPWTIISTLVMVAIVWMKIYPEFYIHTIKIINIFNRFYNMSILQFIISTIFKFYYLSFLQFGILHDVPSTIVSFLIYVFLQLGFRQKKRSTRKSSENFLSDTAKKINTCSTLSAPNKVRLRCGSSLEQRRSLLATWSNTLKPLALELSGGKNFQNYEQPSAFY
jgi:hypothetical protein